MFDSEQYVSFSQTHVEVKYVLAMRQVIRGWFLASRIFVRCCYANKVVIMMP